MGSFFRNLVILFFGFVGTGCIQTDQPEPKEQQIVEIVSITGGSVSLEATDSIIKLSTQEILDSEDLPVKDGTMFSVIGSSDVPVSSNQVDFSQFIKVPSLNGKIIFYVKPPTLVGNYKVTVSQSQKQTRNATGFFYLDIKHSDPDSLGEFSSSTFNDSPPFNAIKDDSEKYTVLADGQTSSALTIGPIADQYGNLVSSGHIKLIASKGEIVSENPAPISDGFATFYFLPTEDSGDVSFKAQAVDERTGLIIKEIFSSVLQVRPSLSLSGELFLGSAYINSELKTRLTLSNTGNAPIRNLQLKVISPYKLGETDPCPKILNQGEQCSFDVVINSKEGGDQFSELEISASPANVGLDKKYVLHSKYVSPPNVIPSIQEINFGQVSCGSSKEIEFYVQNFGDTDANEFSFVEPTVSDQERESVCSVKLTSSSCNETLGCFWANSKKKCSSNQFEAFSPDRDPNVDFSDPDLEFADCGNSIPAGGLKCRVVIRYNPRSLSSGILAVARLNAKDMTSVPIDLFASSSTGSPSGEIPIIFSADKLGLSSSNSVNVTVGPVKDACGNKVSDSSSYTASVSAGRLDKINGNFKDGVASLTWYGSDTTESLGEQTFSISSNVTGTKKINFSGVYLAIDGESDLGEIAKENPEEFSWKVKNLGNEDSTNTSILFEQMSNLNSTGEQNNCATIAAGGECTVSALLYPSFGELIQTGQISGRLRAKTTTFGKNNVYIDLKGFGNQQIVLTNLVQSWNYGMGKTRAAEKLTRVVNLKNGTGQTLSGLSYEFSSVPGTEWTVSSSTCGEELQADSTCKFNISYYSTVSGGKSNSFLIKNSEKTFSIDFTIDVVGSDPANIPIALSSEELPSNGISTAQIIAGPITDLYGNIVPDGIDFSFETEIGELITKEAKSGLDGMVYSEIRSNRSQVGYNQLRVKSITRSGEIVSRVKNMTFTGPYLVFDSDNLDFGSLAMNLTKDLTIDLKNIGNIDATNLTFESENPITYSLVDSGNCASGIIPAGQSCPITIRFLSPISDTKQENNFKFFAKSSNNSGKESALLNLSGVNLLPATMLTEQKSIAVQYIQNSFYVTKIKVHNVGDDIFRNFSVSSNRPENLSFSEYEGCENLVGGGSCSVTLTFSSFNLLGSISAIIGISADGTSSQVTFTSDKIGLSFVNPTFDDKVFSCHPIQIEAKDSNNNSMTVREYTSIAISSIRDIDNTIKKGQFFRNKSCSGPTVSRANISQGNSVSELIYFRPEVAGKHTLVAKLNETTSRQDNQANLVVSPGNVRIAAPREPLFFNVLGANGPIGCEFISRPTTEKILPGGDRPPENEQARLTYSQSQCNYISGTIGEVTDNFVIKDQDSPPNTIAVSVTTTKAIKIRPESVVSESGGQVQFFAEDGSGVNYRFKVIPESPVKKIGSYFSNNIYNAGLNVTSSDTVKETIVVTDSFGAEAKATVFVKKSLFNHEQKIIDFNFAQNIFPSMEQKAISVWKNVILVGDPGATVNGVSRAGAAFVYTKNMTTGVWEKTRAIVSPSPTTDGEFGISVSLFNGLAVIGAPGEMVPGKNMLPKVGVAYFLSVVNYTPYTYSENIIRIIYEGKTSDYDDEAMTGLGFGYNVKISNNSVLVSSRKSGKASLFKINPIISGTQISYNLNELVNTLKSAAVVPVSIDLFDNINYGGIYAVFGNGKGGVDLSFFDREKFRDNGFDPIPGAEYEEQEPEYGKAVSTYGPYVVIGSPNARSKTQERTGKVFIYKRNANREDNDPNNWGSYPITELDPKEFNLSIKDGARFGESVSIWGNYILIGAPGEANYPNLINSGSVYIFQRYLSADNKWEYLGQIRAPDYDAGAEFGKKVSHYTNTFVTSSKDGVYVFSSVPGKKLENKWPFGYHDSLIVSGTVTQTGGTMKDYSSLTINSNGNYYIIEPEKGWTSIGVTGELRLDGVISSLYNPVDGVYSSLAPDESGFNLGESLYYNIIQRPGGSGGRSTSVSSSYGVKFYNKWLSEKKCGFLGCCCTSAGNHDYMGSCSGAYSINSESGQTGFSNGVGGAGGYRRSGTLCISPNCTETVPISDGHINNGGDRGLHGGLIYIRSNYSLGSGSINVSATNGGNGQRNDSSVSGKFSAHNAVHEDRTGSWKDYCNKCAKDKINCNGDKGFLGTGIFGSDDVSSEVINSSWFGGLSGSGGGGAGGSGGKIVIRSKYGSGAIEGASPGWSYNLSNGIGGISNCFQNSSRCGQSGPNGVIGTVDVKAR